MPSASCAGRSEIENSTASLRGVVLVALPRRHRERVIDAAVERFAVDDGGALAFGDRDGASVER